MFVNIVVSVGMVGKQEEAITMLTILETTKIILTI